MNLLLITKEEIVKKIFLLVCKNLDIDLILQDNTQIQDRYDIIILDIDFIDDRFNIIKQYSKKLGAISPSELPFDKAKDFLIKRPFLPSHLTQILKEQLEKLEFQQKKENKKQFIADFETQNVTNYLDSLADDIVSDIEIESDESIIKKPHIKQGGVLDGLELTKIKSLLEPQKIDDLAQVEELDETDWLDLSQIIDKALAEVQEYKFDEDRPIKLILNRYSINELKPLLQKLNQNVIDSLTHGKEVSLVLKLKDDK